jgi:hypothetical protein
MGKYEGELTVSDGEGERRGFAGTGIEPLVCDIVVDERELSGEWGEVLLTPPDHPGVVVEPYIAFRGPGLLDELAGDAATAAPEVEYGPVGLVGHIGEDVRTRGIVIARVLQRPH